MSRFVIKVNRAALLCGVLIALPVVPAAALECGDNCVKSELIHVENTVSHIVAGSSCFETHLPADGILMLDLASSNSTESRAELRFLGQYGGPVEARETFVYLQRQATRMLLEIQSAGSYLFCVAAEEQEVAPERYKLTSGFVAFSVAKDGDPKEYEPEGDP